MNESQLVRTIKAHIAAGDKAADKSKQHYTSAGQHLKTPKASDSKAGLEALLRDKVGKPKVKEYDIPVNILEYVAEQLGISWEKAYACIIRLDEKRFEYGVIPWQDQSYGVARIIELDGPFIRQGRPRLRTDPLKLRKRMRQVLQSPPTKLRLQEKSAKAQPERPRHRYPKTRRAGRSPIQLLKELPRRSEGVLR